MENYKNTKVSIEHCGRKVTIELGSWDTDIDELMQTFRALAVAVGYSIEGVNEYIQPD